MINYIINFIICSGMLLLVYRAFLGAENLYRFNRFYLLFSLIFSLIVPATTIHVPYVNMPAWDKILVNKPLSVITHQPVKQHTAMPVMLHESAQNQNAAPVAIIERPASYQVMEQPIIPAAISQQLQHQVTPAPTPTHHYFPEILLAVYALITLILLFRFAWNSYRISRVVANSIIINYQDTKLVLVTADVTPHSFLRYVFLNKAAYYNKAIEPEIICHEQTHVRQLHSLDVIFIEVLQIIFWFNFFIPFYRRAIQLNHEFLADEAVIESYRDTPAYQHLLLAKASQSGSLYLTSQFNYLVTKKRIIMMTKRTTAAIAIYKRLALLPVLAIAIFLFSQKTLAQKAEKVKQGQKTAVAPKSATQAQSNRIIAAAKQDAPQRLLDEYSAILAKYHIPYNQGEKINRTPDFTTADKERLTTLYKQMSAKQQQHQYVRLVYLFPPPIIRFTQKDLVTWQNNTGYIVYIDDKQINNADLAKYKVTDFHSVEYKQQPVPLAKEGWHWKVTLMTPAYYKAYEAKLMKTNYRLVYIPKKNWKAINRQAGGTVLNNKQAKTNIPIQADTSANKQPLIILNGTPYTKTISARFNLGTATNDDFARALSIDAPNEIASVTVLKDKAAIAAWGERGANGVIIINTSRGLKTATDKNEQALTIKGNPDSNHYPLVVVDGKVINKKVPSGFDFGMADNTQYTDWLAIAPNDISTISILKDRAAMDMWGERGANGVLLITTKHPRK